MPDEVQSEHACVSIDYENWVCFDRLQEIRIDITKENFNGFGK